MIVLLDSHMGAIPGTLSETKKNILQELQEDRIRYFYQSREDLMFEVHVREQIIEAARKLDKSGAEFSIFQTSRFNPLYWTKTRRGYQLKPDASSSAAILDIFKNGHLYAFECSTAIVIIFYYAVLHSIRPDAFNFLFQNLLVWDWSYDEDLRIITRVGTNFIPGDVIYFSNPDFEHPAWIGENTVYLGNDLYFGHGIGIKSREGMIQALNTLRKPNAVRSAFVLPQHSRLDFNYLRQFSV